MGTATATATYSGTYVPNRVSTTATAKYSGTFVPARTVVTATATYSGTIGVTLSRETAESGSVIEATCQVVSGATWDTAGRPCIVTTADGITKARFNAYAGPDGGTMLIKYGAAEGRIQFEAPYLLDSAGRGVIAYAASEEVIT